MKWHPKKTIPKDGTWVLAMCSGKYSPTEFSVVRWCPHRELWRVGGVEDPLSWCEPTHWMPLPPPPSTRG